MMNISTLRPGLLVSLHTGLRGNVSYRSREIEADHIDLDGARKAAWETHRTIEHPREHEEAVKIRGKARSLISGVCSPSSFGLLCPESSRELLTEAIADARALIDEFNANASVTRVSFSILIGRVAADDVEAIRAINGEVRDLLTAMERGLKNLDVEAVRDAANKAKALSSMLSPEAATRAQKAIDVARNAARRIVKAGEAAAVEIDEATMRTIQQSRAAFIDLEDTSEVQEPIVTGRAIDLDVQEMPDPVDVPAVAVPSLEL